jgi:dTMP kinase
VDEVWEVARDEIFMKSGFFVLEGCEAVGKTTQLKRLEQALIEKGFSVLVTREPGGTLIGEQIRSILLDAKYADTIQPLTSLLLFNASRHQWIHEVIKPALAAGKVILSDRSFISTMVYQGYVEGLDLDFVKSVCLRAVDNILPDKIFLLDISVEEMKRRLKGSPDEKITRYDIKGEDFHKKIREGYLAQIDELPGLIKKIDGESPVEDISHRLLDEILTFLV